MTEIKAANERENGSSTGECGTGAGAASAWSIGLVASAAWSFVELNSARTLPFGLYKPTLASIANRAASRHNTAPSAEIRQCRCLLRMS